jgi:hypothetical protein
MTIKTQGGKVITKDGKVSCECCEEPPGECCMYPAQALFDGLYTYEDLPDVVIVSRSEFSGQFTKLDPPTDRVGPPAALNYYSGSSGDIWIEPTNNGQTPLWAYQYFDESNESITIVLGPCLINGHEELAPNGDRRDQFADTYTASGVPDVSGLSTITLTRTSLCIWEGVNFCGDPVILGYNRAGDTILDTYHWYIYFQSYLLNNCQFPEAQEEAEKTDPQSSPAGSYINVNVNITVS